VSRGYIGVSLRDVDSDLQRSLGLPVARGALVQDVTDGSPAELANIRPYDIVLAFDDEAVTSDDELIRQISGHAPGSAVRLRVLRDGREQTVTLKLAERPLRDPASAATSTSTAPDPNRIDTETPLGLTVRDLDAAAFNRYQLPRSTRGVLISRVEAMSASFDADVRRGTVLLEINRRPVESAVEYRRLVRDARPGDVLAFYIYVPDIQQRKIVTVRVDDR
jgi:serine protease Do